MHDKLNLERRFLKDLETRNLVEVLHKLDNLADEQRYKSLGIIKESVLDHVGLSLQILAYTHHLLPDDIDKFETSMMLTTHDNGEAIVGDIEKKTKEQAELEALAVKKLVEKYTEAYQIACKYAKRDSKEAKIAKSIDILQGTIRLYLTGPKVRDYMKRSRKTEDTRFSIEFDDNIYTRMVKQLRDVMELEGYFLSELEETNKG